MVVKVCHYPTFERVFERGETLTRQHVPSTPATRTPHHPNPDHGGTLNTHTKLQDTDFLREMVADYADDLQRTANRTTGIDHQFWQLVANHMRDLTV